MNNPEIKEQAKIKIEDLPEFEIWKIRDESCDYIFETICNDEEKLKEFLTKFDEIGRASCRERV